MGTWEKEKKRFICQEEKTEEVEGRIEIISNGAGKLMNGKNYHRESKFVKLDVGVNDYRCV